MGNERTETNGKVSGLAGAESAGGQGKSSGNSSPSSSEGRRETQGGQTEKIVSGLPVLESKEPKNVAVQVPQGDGTTKKVTSTKKKTSSKKKPDTKQAKKEASKEETKEQVSMLLQTVTEIASIKTGPLWKLEKEECDKIASPLVNILDRYHLMEKAGENSDWIALVTALGMAVVPRLLVAREQSKRKGGVALVDTRNEKRETPRSSEPTLVQTTRPSENPVKQLLAGFDVLPN